MTRSNHSRVPRRTCIMGDMMKDVILHRWIGYSNHAEMALLTLASFDNQQTDHHSMAFSIASAFDLQARAHLQCLTRNQCLHVDAREYSASFTYFTCAFSE